MASLTNGSTPFFIKKAREAFPALKADQIFFDNAGGTQVLGSVIDAYVLSLFDFDINFVKGCLHL